MADIWNGVKNAKQNKTLNSNFLINGLFLFSFYNCQPFWGIIKTKSKKYLKNNLSNWGHISQKFAFWFCPLMNQIAYENLTIPSVEAVKNSAPDLELIQIAL